MSDIARSANDDPARPVAEIMHRAVVTARPSQRVADALAQPGAEGLGNCSSSKATGASAARSDCSGGVTSSLRTCERATGKRGSSGTRGDR